MCIFLNGQKSLSRNFKILVYLHTLDKGCSSFDFRVGAVVHPKMLLVVGGGHQKKTVGRGRVDFGVFKHDYEGMS